MTTKKKKNITPSPIQSKLVKLMIKEVKSPRPRPLGTLCSEAGYAPSYARMPGKIIKKEAVQRLIARHAPVERMLKTIYDLSGDDNDDKDNRLRASIEGLKLNDAYPTQKRAIVQLFDKVSNVFNEE